MIFLRWAKQLASIAVPTVSDMMDRVFPPEWRRDKAADGQRQAQTAACAFQSVETRRLQK
jgi:hypothetical protein